MPNYNQSGLTYNDSSTQYQGSVLTGPFLPRLVVEIAFGSGALEPIPSWTDVSQWVINGETHRGRQHELNQIQAGTARLRLDNRDGRFNPFNTQSPYWMGGIGFKPMKPIRIRAVFNNITYDVWRGYIDSWPMIWANVNTAEVDLNCTDAFRLLNLLDLGTTSRISERSDQRVSWVLDTVGWPSADRVIAEVGVTNVSALSTSAGQTKALAHMQIVAESEAAPMFISPSGKVVFYNRNHPNTATASTVVQVTLGDGGAGSGELPYLLEGTQVTLDDLDLWNEVVVSPSGLSPQTTNDSASIGLYGKRTLSKSTINSTVGEGAGLATALLAKYKDPDIRVKSVAIYPSSDYANLFPQVLTRDIQDLVQFKRRVPGASDVFIQDSLIEGVHHTFSVDDWRTTWNLSATDVQNYWILGRDQLNTSTRLA